MSLSTVVANEILDSLFVSKLNWVSLHSGDPGETGRSELPGPRQRFVCGGASKGQCGNDAAIEFIIRNAVVVTHIGVWDASTGGVLVFTAEASQAKTVAGGDLYRIDPAQLTIAIRV